MNKCDYYPYLSCHSKYSLISLLLFFQPIAPKSLKIIIRNFYFLINSPFLSFSVIRPRSQPAKKLNNNKKSHFKSTSYFCRTFMAIKISLTWIKINFFWTFSKETFRRKRLKKNFRCRVSKKSWSGTFFQKQKNRWREQKIFNPRWKRLLMLMLNKLLRSSYFMYRMK